MSCRFLVVINLLRFTQQQKKVVSKRIIYEKFTHNCFSDFGIPLYWIC